MKLRYLLYKSFDKKLSEQEKIYLEEGLSASKELRKEKEDIALLRKTVSQSDYPSFGAGFVDGVMTEIVRLEENPRTKHTDMNKPKSKFLFFRPQYSFAMALILLIAVTTPTLYSWLTTTRYSAQKGNTLSVTLPDNSIVQLNAESSVSYPSSFNNKSRMVSLDGEAYFDVKKGTLPFVVHYDHVEVQVLGTKFNVYAREQNIEVSVNEGVVKVGNDIDEGSYKEVILTQGQIVTFDTDEQPGTPQIFSNTQFPGWIYGKFIFDQANLGNVCKEIERKFDVEIDLASTDLGTITVTGVMEADNLSDVLATISLLTKRPYKFEKERYIFY
jgi:ferric-dicitrate binding protein FerR (iron transport regulator)